MKPTIGRIVIYNTTAQEQEAMQNTIPNCNVQQKLPAIVVAVWSETMVNLQVIGDGEKLWWKTSAQLGEGEGQWQWPEIVADKEGM